MKERKAYCSSLDGADTPAVVIKAKASWVGKGEKKREVGLFLLESLVSSSALWSEGGRGRTRFRR